MEIEEDIEAPIYVYYQLDNFYQNHRKYTKSRSLTQLKGEDLSPDDLSLCEPVVYNEDLFATHSWGGKKLDPKAAANPCGLVANSFFNDTYKIFDKDLK